MRNNNYNNRGGGVGGRNNINDRPNRNTFNNRGDNGLFFYLWILFDIKIFYLIVIIYIYIKVQNKKNIDNHVLFLIYLGENVYTGLT